MQGGHFQSGERQFTDWSKNFLSVFERSDYFLRFSKIFYAGPIWPFSSHAGTATAHRATATSYARSDTTCIAAAKSYQHSFEPAVKSHEKWQIYFYSKERMSVGSAQIIERFSEILRAEEGNLPSGARKLKDFPQCSEWRKDLFPCVTNCDLQCPCGYNGPCRDYKILHSGYN